MEKKKTEEGIETTNKLKILINQQSLELSTIQNKRVRESDVEELIASHCGAAPNTIAKIKRHVVQPSLPMALKIADYFKLPLEDIFQLKDSKRH
ncbi:helix-turn-helix transcriptional regulator [Niallia circulans]|uniref:helix-turn-helix transcriptional regulator n=1 Tax=Niallia circulans TaxID=1397 RepID=UPI0026EF2ECA|nr:hypothetical protein [Niallia circulans]